MADAPGDAASSPVPAALGVVGSVVAAALGAREAVLGLLQLLLHANQMTYYDPGPWDGPVLFSVEIVGGLAVAGVASSIVARLLQDGAVDARARRLRRLAVPAALLPIGLLVALSWARHGSGYFAMGFVPPRSDGDWPFPAHHVFEIERQGYRGTVHANAHGHRRCRPEEGEGDGEITVTWIGDSFVFGQAVDDEATLCWRFREHFDAQAPGRFRFRNLGQQGASLHSYVDTLAYVHDTYGTDLVVMGLLLPNDAEVLDTNAQRRVSRAWWFRLGASILDPHVLYAAMLMHIKVWRSDFFEWVSIDAALEDLDEEARDRQLPVLVYMYDSYDRSFGRGGQLTAYAARVQAMADGNPWITFAGLKSEPYEEGRVMRIPGDSHPTPEGHAWMASQLLVDFEPWVEGWEAQR
ncbi:MAG: hypothetical protein H6732_18765 [Alphaproteobacteria bacterium]|nr:hypothetical protein [Alphaproteobacteria bacterium]